MTIDLPIPDPAENSRSGMVAVVGRANVGKSTLINGLLGEKVSIVSPVAQTTRNLIRGIHTEERGQICFLDTPGMHRAESDLGKVMNRIARASIEGVDAILFLMDVSLKPRVEDDGWMRRLSREQTPVIGVLNKCDKPADNTEHYQDLWTEICAEKSAEKTMEWVRISAQEHRGTRELLGRLFDFMPVGPHLFPEDIISDFPRKLNIADVVREKFFGLLHNDMPHNIAIWVEAIDESAHGWAVDAVVYVQQSSQKGIVIGNKGRLLRKVRRSAEAELTSMYELPIRINLWVKVEKNWAKNFWMLKKFGYIE